MPFDKDNDRMARDVQILDSFSYPRVIFLQDNFFKSNVLLFVKKRFCAQDQGVSYFEHHVPAGDERTAVALDDGKDDPRGEV